jgi:hypothetical protein
VLQVAVAAAGHRVLRVDVEVGVEAHDPNVSRRPVASGRAV